MVIIGIDVRDLSPKQNAFDYVLEYTVCNDVSA